jgi:hypothetical protein
MRHAPMSRVNLDQCTAYVMGHELHPDGRRDQVRPDVSQDTASFVLGLTSPGAGQPPHLEVAREAECVRL